MEMPMRYGLAVVPLLFAAVASAAPVVDLRDPDALESLRERNPRHFGIVTRILEVAREVRPVEVPRTITVRYEASDVLFLPLVNVSDPPKMKLAFTLESVRYEAVVVPNFAPATILPAARP
jgi:hypothetical protein